MAYLSAQVPGPYRSGNKWGYKLGDKILIEPQYDTVFPFDRTGRIAMVANKNLLRTEINPLTGEEIQVSDYYFISPENTKLSLKLKPGGDSILVFPAQQELKMSYLTASPVFKVLYNQKVWLFHKSGKQLSEGFDDIFPATRDGRFFETETYSVWDKDVMRIKGLIDTSGKVIVTCAKKHIHINTEDSMIYTCSTIFNRRLSDEVFDYKGNMIYNNNNHIEFAARNLYVYKIYEPKEVYMFANDTKDLYGIEGQEFYNLKHKKALIVDRDTWLLVNLQTGKKQKVNKDAFWQLTYQFIK